LTRSSEITKVADDESGGALAKHPASPSVKPKQEGCGMAEKVARLGIRREKDFMYYIKDGSVWKVPRKQPGVPKGRPEKVADGGVDMDFAFIYFLDKDGDISRAKRAIGGQKRKTTARAAKKATRKGKKAKARKPAKKKAKKGKKKK